MRHILTFSALLFATVLIFSSCKKKYTCTCKNSTFVVAEQDTVKTVTNSRVIRATEEDAENQCQDYDLEGTYLGRPSIEYYDCTIAEFE